MAAARRVYAHRVRIDGILRFAISAPESGITETFETENELEAALDRLGFPHGFSHDVVHALHSRGIVWLDVDAEEITDQLKGLSAQLRGH